MPRFEPGQSVLVAFAKSSSAPAGRYKIVSAMPPTHGVTRYRVRGDGEACERVVDENLLTPQVL